MLAIVMLLTMIAGIFVGIPVSFTLIFLALGFGFLSIGENIFDLAYYNLVGTLSNEVFIAIPMFIFMGYICEKAGLVEKLFYSMKSVVGNLNIVVIVIAVLVSLATGVVGASVTLLGIMAGIGSDHVDLQAAMDNNVDVVEVTYCNSRSVAEHIVMMILSLVRDYQPT